jgi:hypothetical protein
MKSEKGRMTHELNRDIERKKRSGRTVRRAAPASSSRDERSARDKFLTASLDLFAERNFASVTIKDIAKALNVNTALIYFTSTARPTCSGPQSNTPSPAPSRTCARSTTEAPLLQPSSQPGSPTMSTNLPKSIAS